MDLGLKDKAFVIGGGSKGLGRGIAQALVAEGARWLLVSRDEESRDRAVAELGPAARAFAADMAYPGTGEQVANEVDAQFGGRLDGLLVNAGGPPAGKALELSDEQWLAAYQLLIGGPLRLLRTLVPKMERGGAILFITSTSVRQPIPNLDTSNVLRPGVAALAKTLARELAPTIRDRKSTPLNSSHLVISYAVVCLKRKNNRDAGGSDRKPRAGRARIAVRTAGPAEGAGEDEGGRAAPARVRGHDAAAQPRRQRAHS